MSNMIRCARGLAASTLTLWALNLAAVVPAAETVPLSSLDLSKMSAGWGKPVANRSVQDKPMSIAGRTFRTGRGHARGELPVDRPAGRLPTLHGLGGC